MVKTEVKTYSPLPGQRRFHESNAMLRLYQGGFGAGKTLAGIWESIDVSMAYPGNFGVICRKTYRELADTTQRMFFDTCPPQLIKNYRARDELVELVNGSAVIFRSLDDPNKFRSLNIGWFYIDEASEVEDEDIPTMLVGRLRLAGVPWRGGWMTSNPSTVEHWLYEWFVNRAARQPERYFMVKATSYENPHLPKEYVQHLEQEYSKDWVRRYLLGEFGFIIKGTQVYTNFNANIHVVPSVPWLKDRPIVRAWDFGWHHPAVLYSQLGPDRQWMILRETMGSNVLLHQFADVVVTDSNLNYPGAKFIDVGDPAGHQHSDKDARSSIEVLDKKYHIKVQTRRFAKKRLIEMIDQRLAMVSKDKEGNVTPKVLIAKDLCPTLISGFEGGYAWPKATDGKIRREEPIEDGYFEHLQDCAQYSAAALFLGGMTDGPLTIVEPTFQFS